MPNGRTIIFAFLLTPACLLSQTEYIATRIQIPPKIDGLLNDSCWQNIPVAAHFTTNIPVFGNPASEKTEIKIVYDDNAIYIGCYMYDKRPEKINIFTPRDNNTIADELLTGWDTYNDKTTAFRFDVTASNVQSDRIMSPFIPLSDATWDAVWESATKISDSGWVVEMKIPFAAFRFPNTKVQEWGLQFIRYVRRTGEYSSWSPWNPELGSGQRSIKQYGVLKGIHDIKPPPRLSLWPYISFGMKKEPGTSSQNNFKPYYSGGLDVKYGLNQSYTLDATLVPDFSQVQSDNTVLNLTPFEIKYEEKRQFFTEGMDMFSKAGIFYSRRIGATPSNYSTVGADLSPIESIVLNPSVTRLYNATKITGRNKNGLGTGILNAITQPAYALVRNDSSGKERKILTEPLINYNVFVLDQSIKNNSKIGIINTNVLRQGNDVNANVTAFDFLINTKNNDYSWNGNLIYSNRWGKNIADSAHDGISSFFDFAKVSKKFQFEISNTIISKNYNNSDLGILGATNRMQNFGAIKYFNYKPQGIVLNWSSLLSFTSFYTLSNMSFQQSNINGIIYFLFRNFSALTLNLGAQPLKSYDIYEPRLEGQFFIRPENYNLSFIYSTDSRKKYLLLFGATVQPYSNPDNHLYYDITFSPTLIISNKLNLAWSTIYTRHLNNQGFATLLNADTAIFGLRNQSTTENILNAQYFISAYRNINFRIRDYWSQVVYGRYYNLEKDGTLSPTAFNPRSDLTFNAFTMDISYNWQFAPGSYLSIVWKTIINYSANSRQYYFDSFSNALSSPQFNSLSAKLIYYLDYVKLKRTIKPG